MKSKKKHSHFNCYLLVAVMFYVLFVSFILQEMFWIVFSKPFCFVYIKSASLGLHFFSFSSSRHRGRQAYDLRHDTVTGRHRSPVTLTKFYHNTVTCNAENTLTASQQVVFFLSLFCLLEHLKYISQTKDKAGVGERSCCQLQ